MKEVHPEILKVRARIRERVKPIDEEIAKLREEFHASVRRALDA